MRLLLITVGLAILSHWSESATARRVRVRPVQLEYYAEQEDEEGPVLLSRQDNYGRATGEARVTRVKDVSQRAPPVQTIRNYNKLNDDGSFTFGYEAADGSFKEETRGTDCVVRGKYGYIDPDGNKREFTYVSGNPCDPNAVEQEEEQIPDSGEENIPANIPRRPILRPSPNARPKPIRPATTYFQQDFRPSSSSEEEDEQEDVRPVTRLPLKPVPSLEELEREIRPRVQPTPRPQPVAITPRPQTLPTRPQTVTVRPQRPQTIAPRPQKLPATTYRPTTASNPTVYIKQSRPTTPSSSSFEEELKSFQLENNLVTTPRPRPGSNHPIYTTELVFDPSSGQYNTVVYQTLPQTTQDLNLRQRLQPFVPSPQYTRTPYVQPARPQRPTYQQQLFQTQQSNLLQQSQQLYRAQQERKAQQVKELPASLLQQEPHRFTAPSKPFPTAHSQPQPFYYLNSDRHGVATGQIDAFLRGHNIAI